MKFSGIVSLFALSAALAAPAQAQSAPPPAPVADAAHAPAAKPRPNVLIWMLDDVGFAQLSCFGGLIATPNIDRVAAQGLRYTNYHTAPICSASRAAMLTGRNPHSVHMGGHAAGELPFPGYDSNIPAEDGTVAAYLHAAGYATLALGKWDHLPSGEMSPAGPFNHWPQGQGFDHFYGFLAADTDNWKPALMRDSSPVATPKTAGYHLNTDLADQAIAMIDSRSGHGDPNPFLMYFATGTAHAPHHAPQAWIDRYKGKFDRGWDKAREVILANQIRAGLMPKGTVLGPRPDGLPRWDTLSPDQQRLYARQMEVFAASLSFADEQFGRVLDKLRASGELDNTIVMVTSDNGASAEGGPGGTHNEVVFINRKQASDADNLPFIDKWGGPETYPHYHYGWALAGNTPLPYFKQTTHEGGERVPLVVSWPGGIKAQGQLRNQYVYVDDLTPTILELTGVAQPAALNGVAQTPLEGISIGYSLNDAAAPGRKHVQYSEMYGNKALWADDWLLVTSHRLTPWTFEGQQAPDAAPWELYDLKRDPTETVNLAARNPAKVREMAALFDAEAKAHNVYPINPISALQPYHAKRLAAEFQRRGGRWIYPGPISHIADFVAPPTSLRPYRLTVQLDLPTGRETGPVFVQGGSQGGIALYLKDGMPMVALRDLSGKLTVISGNKPLSPGANRLEMDLDRPAALPMTEQALTIALKVGGAPAGGGKASHVQPATYGLSEMFDLGIDWGSAVSPDYPAAVAFPGTIGRIEFDFNR